MTDSFTRANLAALAPDVEALARRVGLHLDEIFRSRLTHGEAPAPRTEPASSAAASSAFWASAKTDGSPVTQADLLADTLLQAGLRALTPGIAVVSEESPVAENATTDATDAEGAFGEGARAPFWLVDPLDGTRAFLAGDPNYCICIALIDSGSPVFGLIHAPATATSWWSWRDAGQVWRKAAGPGPEEVLRKRGPVDPGLTVVRLAVSAHHHCSVTNEWLRRYPDAEVVAMSSALKFCALVEGRLDLYPRPGATMAWDTAAGQCLVEAAGGEVRSLDGGAPLRYRRAELRNPGFVASFVVDD